MLLCSSMLTGIGTCSTDCWLRSDAAYLRRPGLPFNHHVLWYRYLCQLPSPPDVVLLIRLTQSEILCARNGVIPSIIGSICRTFASCTAKATTSFRVIEETGPVSCEFSAIGGSTEGADHPVGQFEGATHGTADLLPRISSFWV